MRTVLLALLLTVGACHRTPDTPTLVFTTAALSTSGHPVPKSDVRFRSGEITVLVADGRDTLGHEGFVELQRNGRFVSVSPPMAMDGRGVWWSMGNLAPGHYKAVLHLQGKPQASTEFVVEP